MNLDLAFLVLVGAGTIWGLIRGLFDQVWGLGSIVLIHLTADHWAPVLTPLATPLWPFVEQHPAVGRLALGAGLWAVLMVVGFGLSRMVIKRVKLLRGSNRLLGGALGAAKGLMAAVVITWLTQAVTLRGRPFEEGPDWITGAASCVLLWPYNPLRLDRLRAFAELTLADNARQEALQEAAQTEEGAQQLAGLLDEVTGEDSPRWLGGGYLELLADPRLRSLLADPELDGLLQRLAPDLLPAEQTEQTGQTATTPDSETAEAGPATGDEGAAR